MDLYSQRGELAKTICRRILAILSRFLYEDGFSEVSRLRWSPERSDGPGCRRDLERGHIAGQFNRTLLDQRHRLIDVSVINRQAVMNSEKRDTR